MNTKVVLGALIIVAVLGGVYFSKGNNSTSETTTINQDGEQQKLNIQTGCMTFARKPCGNIVISGTASNATMLKVAMVRDEYRGTKDFNAILEVSKLIDTAPVKIISVPVSAGAWFTSFRNQAGEYRIIVYDGTKLDILAEGKLTVTD